MEEVKIFKSPKFGEIRTAGTNDNPMFCLSDVCRILGLSAKGVNQRLGKDVISNYPLETTGGIQQALFVNEDGLYDVILDSRKPEAKSFRKWVTSEVLPSIRKSGGYIAAKPDESPEFIMARALQIANETIKRSKQQLQMAQGTIDRQAEQLRISAPKVLFADAVTTSQRSCLVAELAKILQQNGVDIGQNRLFTWLRDNGYLCSRGQYYNQPTQKAMELGLFEIKQTSITKPDGTVLVTSTTKVTGKGQVYFVNKFLGKTN